jgi:hypothetical protein
VVDALSRSLDVNKKVEMMKKLHKSVWHQIGKKNEQYAFIANKSHRDVIFEPSDLVWVHIKKEWFTAYKRSKLHHKRMAHSKSLNGLMTIQTL